MSDPTLFSNETPYKGFTIQEIAEKLLQGRGMTLDATTMRTAVITAEETDAYNRIRRAFTLCAKRFPGVFTIQEYSVAWTLGDTLKALPANCSMPVYVNYDGKTCRRLNRVMRQNVLDGNTSANVQQLSLSGDPVYYHIRGITNLASANPPDYRLVLELIPHPTDAKLITIGYNAKAPALASATADDKDNYLPIDDALQEWILRRAQALWAADSGDSTMMELALAEMERIERDLDDAAEANMDAPVTILPEYPTLPSHQRRR